MARPVSGEQHLGAPPGARVTTVAAGDSIEQCRVAAARDPAADGDELDAARRSEGARQQQDVAQCHGNLPSPGYRVIIAPVPPNPRAAWPGPWPGHAGWRDADKGPSMKISLAQAAMATGRVSLQLAIGAADEFAPG